MTSLSRSTSYKWLATLVGAAILISLIQLFSQRSLWLDEAALALNLIEKSPAELLQPLDRYQIAPILFLLISKLIAALGNYSESSFRILPLLCYWASLPLCFLWVRKITREDRIALLVVAFCAFSPRLHEYANEFKQYSGDVLVANAFLFGLTHWNFRSGKGLFGMILLGLLATWLSNITIIMMTTALGYYFLFKTPDRRSYQYFFILLNAWIISFGSYYFIFVAGHPSANHMQEYWASDFLPLAPVAALKFLYLKAEMLFAKVLCFYFLWPFALAFAFYGIFTFFQRGQLGFIFLLTMPLGLHLAISALELYPVETRLTLYLSPFLYALVAIGLYQFSLNFKRLWMRRLIWAGATAFLVLVLAMKFPIEKEELKDSVSYVNLHQQENERILVYAKSKFPLEYYSQQGQMPLRVEGFFHDSEEIRELTSKDSFPTWVIFSHLYPENGSEDLPDAVILKQLESELRILDQAQFKGASAYLLAPRKSEVYQRLEE